jgi:hypothetical protein
MKNMSLFVSAVVLVGLAVSAQLVITSFRPNGELTWSNSVGNAAYQVAWASSLTGRWNQFDRPTNLNSILATGKCVTVQVPMSNRDAQTFYRVVWTPPNPIGLWDYYGYDSRGTLVITGLLSICESNPIVGSWDLGYAGPPTNYTGYLGPQIGTGALSGTFYFAYAYLALYWPSNFYDNNIDLFGTLWPNTYTGQCTFSAFFPIPIGPFTAIRRP